MQARFASTCRRCGQPVEVGATIVKRGGNWTHAVCPVNAAAVGRRFDHIDETLGRNAANEYLDEMERREAA